MVTEHFGFSDRLKVVEETEETKQARRESYRRLINASMSFLRKDDYVFFRPEVEGGYAKVEISRDRNDPGQLELSYEGGPINSDDYSLTSVITAKIDMYKYVPGDDINCELEEMILNGDGLLADEEEEPKTLIIDLPQNIAQLAVEAIKDYAQS